MSPTRAASTQARGRRTSPGSRISGLAHPRVIEWDFYGGYKGSLPADFAYDLGVLYYWYPGTYPSSYYAAGTVSPNTTELYAALTWKFLTFKYSWSANNQTFDVPDSRGSQYLDLTASYDIIEKVSDVIGKVTIFGHVGKQYFHNSSIYDYSDWKVGASTEIYGVTVGIYGSGTNAQDAAYTNVYGKNISANQFVGTPEDFLIRRRAQECPRASESGFFYGFFTRVATIGRLLYSQPGRLQAWLK